MDDSTRNMMLSLGTGIIKKALISAGASFATHGIIASNQIETFVSLGMFAVGIVWSLWNDYFRPIVLAQLEVLKAKSLAQAAALKANGIPPVNATDIAAHSATMNETDVTKAIATLPPAVQATTGKVTPLPVALLALLVMGTLAMPGDARAQAPKLTGNIARDIATATGKPNAPLLTGNIEKDMQALWQKIVSSSLTDLNYAAAMAASANTTTSTVRLQCIKAIITLNEQASGANLKNPDGTPMVKPDPHLFTDVEGLAEIIDNLSPQGPLFVNCAGAAQLAKTNVLSFVNAVVTGAAGFAAMPIIPGL
jgi:hypothetical protein